MFSFGERSEKNLKECHGDLVKVARQALKVTTVDFMVIEGLRTFEEQEELVKNGFSRTLKSRHLPHPSDGLSRALDFAAMWKGQPSFKTTLFPPVISAFKAASRLLRLPIECGGDWKNFKDYGHIQLTWKVHP